MWYVQACGSNSWMVYFNVKNHDITGGKCHNKASDSTWENPFHKVLVCKRRSVIKEVDITEFVPTKSSKYTHAKPTNLSTPEKFPNSVYMLSNETNQTPTKLRIRRKTLSTCVYLYVLMNCPSCVCVCAHAFITIQNRVAYGLMIVSCVSPSN